jgi:hypothetical protein
VCCGKESSGKRVANSAHLSPIAMIIWGLIINERIGQERQGVGMKYTLKILGETGGVALLLSGQTGHRWAGRSVLFSFCGSSEKAEDGLGVILRSLLIGVVATFGEDSQLAPWKKAVKSSGLFHSKDRAPVGIEHQGGAAYGRQDRPQIKIARSVSAAVLGKLIVTTLSRRPVPINHLGLQHGIQIRKIAYKPVPVEVGHRNLAIALSAGDRQGFNLPRIFAGIVNPHDTAFTLSNQMAFFDTQFLLDDPQLLHAFRPIAIALIKLPEIFPRFGSPKAPAVKHHDPVTFRYKGRFK